MRFPFIIKPANGGTEVEDVQLYFIHTSFKLKLFQFITYVKRLEVGSGKFVMSSPSHKTSLLLMINS